MANRVGLDLETLDGNPSTALVLSIGACVFDYQEPWIVRETFYVVLDAVQQQKYYGRTLNADTVAWWCQQSPEARSAIFGTSVNPVKGVEVNQALGTFTAFVEAARATYAFDGVWGYGAAFDNSILASLYKASTNVVPWKYREDRCLRHEKAMMPGLKMPEFRGHPHDALDDAVQQARCAMTCLHARGTPYDRSLLAK